MLRKKNDGYIVYEGAFKLCQRPMIILRAILFKMVFIYYHLLSAMSTGKY